MISVTPEICSCYTINDNGLTWPAARKACQYHGGDLVSMETEHEWQVVKDHVQNRTNRFANDWHIGLRMNASGNWTWVSGKPLTINRWNLSEPRGDESYAVMPRNNTPGTKGRGPLTVVKRDFRAGFICERPSGTWVFVPNLLWSVVQDKCEWTFCGISYVILWICGILVLVGD